MHWRAFALWQEESGKIVSLAVKSVEALALLI
jgi:hypothetical protein